MKRKPAVIWLMRYSLEGEKSFLGGTILNRLRKPTPRTDTGWTATPVKFVEEIPKRKVRP